MDVTQMRRMKYLKEFHQYRNQTVETPVAESQSIFSRSVDKSKPGRALSRFEVDEAQLERLQ